ncbi:MAG: LysR family transcriptional regulator [Dehalobacterium sp.]
MQIQNLREFLILSQIRNFTKAADVLFISQSVLSKHIAQLESELGVDLIFRTNPIQLTEAGEYLATEMKSFLNQYDEIISKLKLFPGEFLGIGLLYYTKYIFSPVISSFIKEYPNIKLRYVLRTPIEIVNAVLNHSIDIGFVMNVNLYPKDLSTVDLYKEPMVVLVNEKHPFAQKKRVSIKELLNEPFINANDNYYKGYFSHFNNICNKYDIEVTEKILVPTFEDILFEVQMSKGIAIASASIKSKIQHHIICLDIEEDNFFFTRTMLYRKENINKALPLFIEYVKNNFRYNLEENE